MNGIVLPEALERKLVETVRARLPRKSYGYLLSDGDPTAPNDLVVFESNLRTTGVWKQRFEAYGRYFVEHDNAGFVASPEEAWQIQKTIWERGLVEVGVFHSHIRHPANFSGVDYDLHNQRFGNLWHLIVSMRQPDQPELRAFRVSNTGVNELSLLRSAMSHPVPGADPSEVLQLDTDGRPRCRDSSAIYVAIQSLLTSPDSAAILDGFLGGSRERCEQYIAPGLKHLGPSEFLMGAGGLRAPHFMGESPAHRVSLSPFHLAEVPVTNELYALFDPRRQDVPASERNHPVVDVSWFDAAVFALWMGCRLPTEAEWEFACGGGSAAEWCCPEESMLPRYAWYSESADSQTHAVATREPNAFGFFDMHGNVWEWCQDVYDAEFYACSPRHDPLRHPCNEPVQSAHRVTRGGCMHSFAEMCRTRYRFHEAPLLRASDIGFRLARSSNPSTN